MRQTGETEMDSYLELVSQGKEAFVEAAFSIGWFEYSSLTYENVSERLTKMDDEKFFVFSLSEAAFDAEGFESEESYQSVLAELLRLTEYMKDAELKCEFDDETRSIGISIQGKQKQYCYSVDTDENGDWFDENVIESFLNKTVLPGEGLDLRFFVLPPCDQTANLVFVPEAMYEEAVERGLIPGEMGYFMEDLV